MKDEAVISWFQYDKVGLGLNKFYRDSTSYLIFSLKLTAIFVLEKLRIGISFFFFFLITAH